ncbi:hypothetical protein [Azospirillum palustre]
MAERKECRSCRLTWVRGNTETYDRKPELAAQKLALTGTAEARNEFSRAVMQSAAEMADYVSVWRLSSCPRCHADLEVSRG